MLGVSGLPRGGWSPTTLEVGMRWQASPANEVGTRVVRPAVASPAQVVEGGAIAMVWVPGR